jgi:hypothetical protein
MQIHIMGLNDRNPVEEILCRKKFLTFSKVTIFIARPSVLLKRVPGHRID